MCMRLDNSGISVLLLGHVTKSGDIAGPRVLEHMVDTVLQMEGSESEEYRLVRTLKNRYAYYSLCIAHHIAYMCLCETIAMFYILYVCVRFCV